MNNAFKWLLFAMLLPLSGAFGQIFETPESGFSPFHSSLQKSIKIDYGFNALSSHLNYPFARDFYTGKFIPDDLIQQNEERLHPLNQIGFESRGELTLSLGSKAVNPGKNKQALVSLRSKGVLGAKYPPNSWALLMKGNGPYEDITLNLSKTGFRDLHWYEVMYGENIIMLQGKSTLHWGVSALILNRFQSLNLSRASLYTAPEGRYIDVVAQGSRASMRSPGIGIGAEFTYGIKLNDRQAIQLYLTDFGISIMGTDRYQIDTSFRFSGFYVTQPADIVSGEQWQQRADSLIDGLTGIKTTSKPVILPNNLGVEYLLKFNESHGMTVELSYRYASYALPHFQITHHVLIRNALSINSGIGYGGWGGFQWNESATFHGKITSLLLEFGGFQSMLSEKLPFQFAGRIGVFRRLGI